MPVYNNEKYFPLAVKSIEAQNYDNYELIIIDDGSTDKTSNIADQLAANNPHIKVIHQKNQWIYNSFNNGISLATGEYIYILNSDDHLIPGALKLFNKKIEEYHPDIIWTKVLHHICDVNQNIIVYDNYNINRHITEEYFYSNKKEVMEAWPFFISSRLALDQANLYKRDIMQSHLFRNDVYAADTLYNISIADDIHSALILQDPIYNHYIYYEDKSMNASVGKYYSYEHIMFNDIYTQYKILFQKWNLPSENYKSILIKNRMTKLSFEFRHLKAENCPLTLEKKLQFLFSDCIDEIIKECVIEGNRGEELEGRVLSGARELLIKESISRDNEMYFVYELLESLLCYEKDQDDLKRIENAINHPLNPMNIGSIFYKKLVYGRK
jgi:glycosyltransferase involved in cell wall biosynthesis